MVWLVKQARDATSEAIFSSTAVVIICGAKGEPVGVTGSCRGGANTGRDPPAVSSLARAQYRPTVQHGDPCWPFG